MVEIDRMALILKPKQAFIEWLKTVVQDPELPDETLIVDPTVVLIPVIDSDEDLGIYINEHCRQWLEHEFASWCINEKEWPINRDLDTFQKYFDVSVHSLVIDNLTEDYHSYENVTLQ